MRSRSIFAAAVLLFCLHTHLATFPKLPELIISSATWFFLIIAGQNVTRSNCAQSPNTAHGGKIPSVLNNLSSIFNIRYAHHCFQQWNFSLFSYFLWLSCCVNTLLNHVMVLQVNYRHAPSDRLSVSGYKSFIQTLSHLKYNK